MMQAKHLLLLLVASTSAFTLQQRTRQHQTALAGSRRDFLTSSSAAALTSALLTATTPPLALAAEEGVGGLGSSPANPIAVIGAGGRCGLYCVNILAEKGLYVRAVTRSGRQVLDSENKFVSYAAGDVTKADSISKALENCSGAIFAASASKNGGDAAHVDYLGVANTADACISQKVQKLAVISSGAVTRPKSIGFKITNVFGRIMDYKIAGETALRQSYANSDLKYTVVRPGGLSDDASKGASGVQVSQGDILSAEISREDVAFVTVAALLSSKTDNATIECFSSGGETLFGQKTGASKLAKDLPDADKYNHFSDTYEGLFDGILNDADMAKTGVISDYTGSKIESLGDLI